MVNLTSIKLPVLSVLGVRYQVKEVRVDHDHWGDGKDAVSLVVNMDRDDVIVLTKRIIDSKTRILLVDLES